MLLGNHGFCRIKNVKFDVCVGRSPVEDHSLYPKNFFPLKPEEVGENAIFEYNSGINPKFLELHSMKSGVAKAEKRPDGTPALRPVAVLEDYVERFDWEIRPGTDETPIRDQKTNKVWTLPEVPDENGARHVTLEDYREGDESQLWRFGAPDD